MHLEHCSRGGASALPHTALPHMSAAAPAAGVAAAAFLDIAAQAAFATSCDSTLQPPKGSGGRHWGLWAGARAARAAQGDGGGVGGPRGGFKVVRKVAACANLGKCRGCRRYDEDSVDGGAKCESLAWRARRCTGIASKSACSHSDRQHISEVLGAIRIVQCA